jgi:hypothetical protein
MFRPSRRAVVFAASFALAFASVAPAAHADRSDDDYDEQSGALVGLIDITDLLGGEFPLLGELPLLGEMGLGGLGLGTLEDLPTVEGIGLPMLEELGLPGLEGLGLDLAALEALGLPLEGPGLPALDGLGLGDILDSEGGLGAFGLPLPIASPLGILDVLSGSGGLSLDVQVSNALTVL